MTSLNTLRNSVRLHWQPLVKTVHDHLVQENQSIPRVDENQKAQYGEQTGGLT
jgi:hypothetical protein